MAMLHRTYPTCLALVEADVGEVEVQNALEDGANTLYFNYHVDCTDVPSGISALREQLEVLHVDNNYRFTTISPRVTALKNLRWLNASYCSLRSVNPSISRLSKLERLTLNNNILTWLPLEVWQLKALEELDLDNNQLNVLPGCLLFLPRLRVLALENNPLYTHEEVDGAAAATYIPAQRSVDCSGCCIPTRNYQVFVTFHTIVGHRDVPFVHFVCSDDCGRHLRRRLEEYDRAHAKQQ
ncbi:leucine-rich repeat protein, putative [Leishmania tarentolae]|uniref:Leucine-rich repeat protein, putative n=1 Tax=Leishmania tarentolae TaxID=5689 RepID=A0A640K9W9_LEITA|nr:leucine-rich repeat protein, putative [Leishmania tarentolae]